MFTEVDSVDEAVELANASTYSLASAVWTKDIHVAFDITSRIRAGTILKGFVSTCATSKCHLLLPRYLQHQRSILPPRVTVRTRRSRVSRSTFMQKTMDVNDSHLSGSSGYGRFNVEDFTDHRVVVVHPKGPKPYPLLGPF